MSWNRFSIAFFACLVLSRGLTADSTPTATPANSKIDPNGIRGSLVICGGGHLDDSIFDRFMELAGGEEANLVVIPTASARADTSDDETILNPWRQRNPKQLSVLHTRDRALADEDDFVSPLRTATAVWISGGSQSRLAEAYLGTAVETELHALLQRDGVIGGSSAGAAIMSRTMIASGNPTPVIKTGLGFLPGAIIDQHFLARNRKPRSIKALADHPGHFGLGIDEDTAVEIRGRRMRVLGDSVVTVLLAATDSQPLRVESLKQGEIADLTALRRAAAQRTEQPFPARRTGPCELKSGSLMIVGGGGVTDEIASRFVQLAGGAEAKIVVLPTASADTAARRKQVPSFLKDRDAKSVTMLPHRTPEEIASDEFAIALREATGIWFGGGRQWRFVDAYEGSPAIAMFRDVLNRGGIIGGSSAGASIQAEFMVRGHPLGNQVMMAEGYVRGFNFLPGVAIDQHLTQRGRLPDLQTVVDRHPQLLGIGIDESTAILVQGSTAKVIGENDVYFLDASNVDGAQMQLPAGGAYDLKQRRATVSATAN